MNCGWSVVRNVAICSLLAGGVARAQNPPQNPQMVPVLQKLLQKYKGCILERYETQQDMRNRGLNGNLSGLSSINGLRR
jgi:hypothetical protein